MSFISTKRGNNVRSKFKLYFMVFFGILVLSMPFILAEKAKIKIKVNGYYVINRTSSDSENKVYYL